MFPAQSLTQAALGEALPFELRPEGRLAPRLRLDLLELAVERFLHLAPGHFDAVGLRFGHQKPIGH